MLLLTEVGIAKLCQKVRDYKQRKGTLSTDPMTPQNGITEQGNLRWYESKYHERNPNQADCGEGKPWVFALQPVFFECQPLKEKD